MLYYLFAATAGYALHAYIHARMRVAAAEAVRDERKRRDAERAAYQSGLAASRPRVDAPSGGLMLIVETLEETPLRTWARGGSAGMAGKQWQIMRAIGGETK